MADNIAIKDGNGDSVTLGADEVSSVKYTRSKIVWGVDGTVADASASNPLPVTTAALPLPSGAATAAKQPALGTAGSASADVITVQGISSMTPMAVSQSGTWNVTNVSGTVSLPSGAATESTLSTLNGKVTACNTGAVTVSSSALPTGAATESTLSTLNGKVTACDTGAVTVSSSALPSGAATESTLSTLNGKVTACNTGAVTVSSSALPSGASTSAKQPALGTAGSASADVITVQGISSMTPLLVNGSGVTQPVSGTVTADTELPAAVTLGDALSNPTTPQIGADLLAWDGAQWVRVRTASTFKDLSAVAIGTIATVWTPTSTKKFRLMGGCISVSAAGNVLFEDNTGGNFIFRTPKLAADTPYNFDVVGGRLSSTADNVLKATLSTTGTITGTIWGTEE